MGIGRANGENRAVTAAQQAIESPLLEVSIDGARGVLFNVIGGNDLSMHEINAAAEAITTAADPDANIIFGATINPELGDEVIITVVATGFDASYYAKRDDVTTKPVTARNAAINTTKQDEKAMSEIDMNLGDDEAATTEFHHDEDANVPNIWALHDDEEKDKTDGSDDDDEEDKTSHQDSDSEDDHEVVSSSLEDELDKPSFLRRLSRRNKHNSGDKSEDSQSEDDEKA